ncbi:MAG: S9 family peptidase [bacterium]
MHRYLLVFCLLCAGCGQSTTKDSAAQSPLISREVLFGNPEKFYPMISPDGTRLSYRAPASGVLNVWVKTIGKNDARPVTRETKRGIYSCYWAPDSTSILYRQDANGDENYHIYRVTLDTDKIDDLTPFAGVQANFLAQDMYVLDKIVITMNKENPQFFDAYTLDLNSGAITLVAKNPGHVVSWLADSQLQVRAAVRTLPDGRQELLYREYSTDDWRSILTVDFEDALYDELYSGLLKFSRDGKYLYLNSSIDADTRRLLKFDPQTKTYIVLAGDPEYDISWVVFNSQTYEPEIVQWEKDRLVAQVLDESAKKKYQKAQSISNGDLWFIHRNNDRNKWVLGYRYDIKSSDFYLYDCDTKQVTFLFCTRPKLDEYKLAPMEPVGFASRDGLKLHGYLTYPVDGKKQNVPFVLLVHGGPFARDSWGCDSAVQWLASRGYACLQINFRGSSGYGKSFLAAGNKEWGAKMHDDLVDAVQWAINQGIADKSRVAIYGCSYGGYAALTGVTATPDLFCCAVDVCGVSDLKTFLQTMPPYWSMTQWEQRVGNLSDEDFLKSRSPLYKIGNIKRPVLIGQGANDPRVKQTESGQIIAAMAAKGLPYEYVLFPDEGHGFAKPENRLKFYAIAEKFLAKHLGGRCEESEI